MDTRLLPAAAATATTCYVVSGAAVVGHAVPDEHWGTRGAVVDGFAAVGFLLTAVVLPAVAAALHCGSVGRIASRVGAVGYAAMAVESLASLVHGGNTWGPVFVVGLLLALVSSVVVSASGLRARHRPWFAALPALALLVGIAAGDQGGFVLLGLGWLALAVMLRDASMRPTVPVEAGTAVRA
jgi:hypothetical protein